MILPSLVKTQTATRYTSFNASEALPQTDETLCQEENTKYSVTFMGYGGACPDYTVGDARFVFRPALARHCWTMMWSS